MKQPPTMVFLLDVDNTLLDNDQLKENLRGSLSSLLGPAPADRFWELYEEVRNQRGYVDFPRTIQLLTAESGEPEIGPRVQNLLDTFPFATYLYPHVMETIAHLKTFGTVVILSDGDSVFQPHKIEDSGLAGAVDGNVLIFVHKELELPKIFARYPADHYVIVDDKPCIISVLERECPSTFTTVLVRQGKYSRDQYLPEPDLVFATIADLRSVDRETFLGPNARSD